MTPPVTVVIPVYNGAPWLCDAIESVLSQSLNELSLLIVDDGSTDGSMGIAESFSADSRVTIRRNERNMGAAETWNRGVGASASHFVKILPQDDLLYRNCLELQVNLLNRNSNASFVACRRDILAPGGRVLIRGRGLDGLPDVVRGDAAVRRTVRGGINPFGEPGSVLFRREAMLRSGGFSENWAYVIDIEAWLRLAKDSPAIVQTDVLAAFRVTGAAWSSRLSSQQGTETKRFLNQLAAENGHVVSASDLWLGRHRAAFAAIKRRVLYAALKAPGWAGVA